MHNGVFFASISVLCIWSIRKSLLTRELRQRDREGRQMFALIADFWIVGVVCAVLGGVALSPDNALAGDISERPSQVWKEDYTVEYSGSLPVSVAFSADGEILLTGDTNGEAMAIVFSGDEPQWRWKSRVGGSHAAVAFSADETKVYATTEHGVCVLDAARGKEEARIEETDTNPIAIGVFPNKTIAQNFTQKQIVFGNARGYFVKTWIKGPDTAGTITTSTVAKDAPPADASAVPLAVDPHGRSAIMTGPVDVAGKVGGVVGKNVLWAYVCGDYEQASPGNRVMVGHAETVVSAAWSKAGGKAITGDVAGRVIVWDAMTMKEIGHRELGGRVAALAISDDGQRAAAYVLGGQGELFVWETADKMEELKPIHTELADYNGPTAFASLSFSPSGNRLAGCAVDKRWLSRRGESIGNVRVWQLAAEPRAQLPPKHLYATTLPEGSSSNFVVLNNHSILMPATREGAVDCRDIADGSILFRLVLGEFATCGNSLELIL